MAKQKNKKPIRIKAGRGVVAKLWKNENKNGDCQHDPRHLDRFFHRGELPSEMLVKYNCI